ncbi:MFS transporter [Micrococcus aloeverae]|uniref:MFS transporter n=1 Tax=Micrococcus aloeverae TaxID=1391911 RepID=UPI001069D7FB|nr:MFS transporter [Micrococcus aloeverae]TFE78964.1 MFS transporter [Micrococcus aloeverae]
MTAVSAWRSRDFRRLWGAATASALGGEIGELALPVLALVWLGASAEELSWVRAATFLPYLLLTLWLGVLVDRWRRRPLMITAETVSGITLLGIAGAALAGWLTVPTLVAAAALLGTMSVLHMLADFSFTPHVVSRDALPDANARMTATYSAIGIGGSGVGGALVQWLTAPFAVAVNGVGRLLSVLLLRGIQAQEPPAAAADAPVRQQVREGFMALVRHRVVRALAAEATIWNLGSEVFMLALTVLVVDARQDGPLVLGMIFMAGGLGAFLGASISARLTDRFGYGRSLITAMLVGNTAPVIGVLFSSDASLGSMVVLAAAFFASGLGTGIANSQAVTVRQLTVPEDLRGRVNASYRMLSWGALSIGALLGGWLISTIGGWPAAVLGTAAMAASTLPVALSPVRKMRHLDDDTLPTATNAGIDRS